MKALFFKTLKSLLLISLLYSSPLFADDVQLKSGKKFCGRILYLEADRLYFRLEIANGHADIFTALEDLEFIRFEPSLFSRFTPETSLAEIRAAWAQQKSFLPLVGSDATAIGLRLCQQLLKSHSPEAAQEALEILPLLERHSPLSEIRTEALALRLEALVLSNRSAEAALLAQAHREATDPHLKISARYALGLLAANQLLALQKKHPRWPEVAALKRQHRKLFDEALDALLYPVVFHPEEKFTCARSLWQVAELYRKTGQIDSARIAARELLQEFPDPHYQPQASRLLKQLEPPL